MPKVSASRMILIYSKFSAIIQEKAVPYVKENLLIDKTIGFSARIVKLLAKR